MVIKTYLDYRIPSRFCIPRLTAAMAAQQHSPMKIAFPPVRIIFTRSVFSPMAAIAMMIKNLDSSFSGAKADASIPAATAAVVITEASRKNRMKNGNTFLSWKFP